jgi:cysteine-rich repeat protein
MCATAAAVVLAILGVAGALAGCGGEVSRGSVRDSGVLVDSGAVDTGTGDGSECGNGAVEPGEACDDGDENGNPNSCNLECTGRTSPTCGNGTVEAGEQCDDGARNGEPGACSADCSGPTPAECGNGVIEAGEQCDDGPRNGEPGACDSRCRGTTPPMCGNGAIEAGEECDDGNTEPGDGCSPQCETEMVSNPPAALSTLDLGLIGTLNHSGWDDVVARILDEALDMPGPRHRVRAQVMYGSGFDAHVGLIPSGSPDTGVNMYREAGQARTRGQSVSLFAIGYLGAYLPDEEAGASFLQLIRDHMVVDLPSGFSGTPTLDALAGSEQINIPYNIGHISVETQADVLFVTPPYTPLVEIADSSQSEEGTRRPVSTFVQSMEDRISATVDGVQNTRRLLSTSRQTYRGEIKLFSAHSQVLMNFVQRLPSLLRSNPGLAQELRTLGGPESVARDYSDDDFARYPQDNLFVDSWGHFAPYVHTILAHTVLMTLLAERDVRYLDQNHASLIDGMSRTLAEFVHGIAVDAVREQRNLSVNQP